MKNKGKITIPHVPPEWREKLNEGYDRKDSNFRKWLDTPLTKKQAIVLYVSAFLIYILTYVLVLIK